MTRPGPLAAHHATDIITQEIRVALKKLDESLLVSHRDLEQKRHPHKKKVVIVKEIMGQALCTTICSSPWSLSACWAASLT